MISKEVCAKKQFGERVPFRPTKGIGTMKSANDYHYSTAFMSTGTSVRSPAKAPEKRTVGFIRASRDLMPPPAHSAANERTKFFPRDNGFTNVCMSP
jgi:hypothetical protein